MRNLVSVGLLVTCLTALGLIGLCAPVQSLIGAKNNFVSNQSSSGMPYDAEVEWIATDGNAYIEIGELPAGSGEGTIELDYYIDTFTGYRNLWGCGKYGSAQICAYFNSGIKYMAIHCRGVVKDLNYLHAPKIWYTQRWVTSGSATSCECYSNGVLVATKDFGKNPTSGIYKLFNCDQNQKPMNTLRMRRFQTTGCYGERDWIPVRIGHVGYMYDRANPEGGPSGDGLYGNITNGVFNVGPDVSR